LLVELAVYVWVSPVRFCEMTCWLPLPQSRVAFVNVPSLAVVLKPVIVTVSPSVWVVSSSQVGNDVIAVIGDWQVDDGIEGELVNVSVACTV
jgi:hypothetical protein